MPKAPRKTARGRASRGARGRARPFAARRTRSRPAEEEETTSVGALPPGDGSASAAALLDMSLDELLEAVSRRVREEMATPVAASAAPPPPPSAAPAAHSLPPAACTGERVAAGVCVCVCVLIVGCIAGTVLWFAFIISPAPYKGGAIILLLSRVLVQAPWLPSITPLGYSSLHLQAQGCGPSAWDASPHQPRWHRCP